MQVDELLAPIAGASPCGEDMSFSNEFDRIAEMRREDDPTLDQGEWVTTLKVAEWPGVARACTELLQQRTKDLRLAMWLTEAWAFTDHYQGLAKGLALCTQLSERHWDTLHPQAEDGDQEQRIGNLSWLLQRVVTLADTRPITRGRQGEAYALRDLVSARQAPAQGNRSPYDAPSDKQDAITLEQFNRIAKETPHAVWLGHVRGVQESHSQLLALQHVIDGHLGADGPGFVQAKEALARALHEIERLAREAGALSAAVTTDAAANTASDKRPATESITMNDTPASSGPLRSRAQALAQLQDVADFFRRTEPHSPVAYLAEKAVKWGEMPLHEWLRKVVKDQGSMTHLQELLGFEDPASP